MTRVVLDPGVLISGIISPRGRVPAAVRKGHGRGCPGLLRELRVVPLRAKFRRNLSEAQAVDLVEEFARAAVLVVDPPDPPSFTPDPKDDYLVALALIARADVLVSQRPGRPRCAGRPRDGADPAGVPRPFGGKRASG